MRALAERSHAQPIRQGFGLPVDHILIRAAWQVLGLTYGPPGGSGRVPVVVDLRLP